MDRKRWAGVEQPAGADEEQRDNNCSLVIWETIIGHQIILILDYYSPVLHHRWINWRSRWSRWTDRIGSDRKHCDQNELGIRTININIELQERKGFPDKRHSDLCAAPSVTMATLLSYAQDGGERRGSPCCFTLWPISVLPIVTNRIDFMETSRQITYASSPISISPTPKQRGRGE